MPTKDVLKYGEEYVPTINDAASSDFDSYETYSRKRIDSKLESIGRNASGYDWTGRLISFDGDSLTWCGAGKFSTVAVNSLGCNELNIAVGGTTMFGDKPGEVYDFRQRVSRIPHNVDLIFINGDFNAAWDVAKTVEECFSTSISTWAGRWNAGMKAIRKSFPNVPVMITSPWATDPSSSKNSHILKYNAQAMLTFARYWGCYFMDFATETPMQLNYGHAWWSSTGSPNPHNNQRAADIVGMVLADRIRTIPPPLWSETDTISIDTTEVTVATGSTVDLVATTTGNHTNAWTSSDNNVACVLGGTVYGMSAGTAIITVTSRNGNKAACTVTVT